MLTLKNHEILYAATVTKELKMDLIDAYTALRQDQDLEKENL